MPKSSASKYRLNWLPVIITAALGIFREVAPEILGDRLKEIFGPHLRWVWAVFGVAVVYAIYAELKNRHREAADEEPVQPAITQSGNRNIASAGDGNVNISGDGNVVAQGTGGDVVARDKITVIHHHAQSSGKSDAPHQLPAPKPDFTGRKAELAELKAHLRQNGQRGIAIAGAQGMGGVGKTELAVKLADELKEAYPDAQIFLDLRGVSERPVTSEQALEHAIRSLDPALVGRLPEDIGELQSLYRSLLDGKRALLVWDNARDAAQVEPLIPPAGSAMIVTSRLHFTLPGLFARNLEALPEADARQLLQRIAPRLTDTQAGALARLCGRLPLALRLVGSALAERPNIKPEKYAEQLADAGKRLALVDASLSLSFALLDDAQRVLWRRLAVFPATFDDAAAGAVWQMEVDDATGALAELIRYSLVDYEAQRERYELHDLARIFADSRMGDEEREVAKLRHAQHFCGVLAEANKLYLADSERSKTGLALLDREQANIAAGTAWAASQPEANQQATDLCIEYSNVGRLLFDFCLDSHEQIRWWEKQLAIARQLQQQDYEGRAMFSLGLAYSLRGDHRKAIEIYEQCLEFHREIGDRRGEGNALATIALTYMLLGMKRKLFEFFESGGTLRETGEPLAGGETRKVIEFFEQYLIIAREIGDWGGECWALSEIGDAYTALGGPCKAIEFFEQRLAIAREISDRRREGYVLWKLALALVKLGERGRAVECAEAALKIYEEIESPDAAMVRERLAEWRGQSRAFWQRSGLARRWRKLRDWPGGKSNCR